MTGVVDFSFCRLGLPLGPLLNNLYLRDLAVKAPLTEPLTIKGCTRDCARMYYKYAGMQVFDQYPCNVKDNTICCIRTVVLASVGAHMDDTVQENVTRGVRETQLRYKKGF